MVMSQETQTQPYSYSPTIDALFIHLYPYATISLDHTVFTRLGVDLSPHACACPSHMQAHLGHHPLTLVVCACLSNMIVTLEGSSALAMCTPNRTRPCLSRLSTSAMHASTHASSQSGTRSPMSARTY